MSLESATYVSDLVSTNPVTGDQVAQGDDHLRLLKAVLQTTFPNASRTTYFWRSVNKSADYTVLATDQNKTFVVDATSASVTLTLPTLTASQDGWAIDVMKSDSSANTVVVAGTIDGATNYTISTRYGGQRFVWSGTAWYTLRDDKVAQLMNWTDGKLVGRSAGSNGAVQEITIGAGLSMSSGTLQQALAAGATMVDGIIAESHTGTEVTFAIKHRTNVDPSSSTPVYLIFRSSTLGSGGYTIVQLTSAISFTFSNGSKAGMVASTAARLWLGAMYTGSAVELLAVNCYDAAAAMPGSIYPFGRTSLISTTAEGGAGGADSAGVPYSTTARTDLPYCVLGYMSWDTPLTPGTWSASPSTIQNYGPQIILPGLPVNQQNYSPGSTGNSANTIPSDNTIPQNTEGTQFNSFSYTPLAKQNILHVRMKGWFAGGAQDTVTCAMFKDSDADAIAVLPQPQHSADYPTPFDFEHWLISNSSAAISFKLRIGAASFAGVVRYLSRSSGALYSTAQQGFGRVIELQG